MGTSLHIFLKFKFLSICEIWRFNISFSAHTFFIHFHFVHLERLNLLLLFYFNFFSILWCNSHTGSDHPQEELAKFGYKSQSKAENFKNLTYYILATSWRTYFLNLGNLRMFFPGNMANLARIFIRKNLLYESHWNFIWHKSDENLSPGSEVVHRGGVNRGESMLERFSYKAYK